MTAEPLGDDLVNDIESGKFDTRQEFKTRGRLLADKYGWDVNQARKIFAFGPTDRDSNVILDATVGIDTREIKDSVVTAFTQYVRPFFYANVLEPRLQDLLQVNNYEGSVSKSRTSNSTPMPSIVGWDSFSVDHPHVSQANIRSCSTKYEWLNPLRQTRACRTVLSSRHPSTRKCRQCSLLPPDQETQCHHQRRTKRRNPNEDSTSPSSHQRIV